LNVCGGAHQWRHEHFLNVAPLPGDPDRNHFASEPYGVSLPAHADAHADADADADGARHGPAGAK
jgi:hypothetical protein